jgi:hypothetical protein
MAVKPKGRVRAVSEHKGAEVVPVIVDAGSQTKGSIRRLKEGRGPLMQEIDEIVQETRASSTVPAGGVLPVVIVYRQKSRKRSRLRIPLSPLDLFR